jgi:agmatine/peptidylarginine deiminase
MKLNTYFVLVSLLVNLVLNSRAVTGETICETLEGQFIDEKVSASLAKTAFANMIPPKLNLRVPAQYEPTLAVLIARQTALQNPDIIAGIRAGGAKVGIISSSMDKSERRDDTAEILERAKNAHVSISKRDFEFIEAEGMFTEGPWIRDYGPIFAVNSNNQLAILKPQYPRRLDNEVTGKLAGLFQTNPIGLRAQFEGGNLQFGSCQKSGSVCIISEKAIGYMNRDLTKITKVSTDQEKNRELIQNATGVDKAVVVPSLESVGEGTGHVDLYVRVLKENVVAVGQLEQIEGAASAIYDSRGQHKYKRAGKLMDEAAKTLQKAGFTVERIPMPPPALNVDFQGNGIFYSHANSLIVNDTMLMPVYHQHISSLKEELSHTPKSSADYSRIKAQIKLFESAESDSRKVFEKYGYKISNVEMSDRIVQGGAVHCLTMQIPDATRIAQLCAN